MQHGQAAARGAGETRKSTLMTMIRAAAATGNHHLKMIVIPRRGKSKSCICCLIFLQVHMLRFITARKELPNFLKSDATSMYFCFVVGEGGSGCQRDRTGILRLLVVLSHLTLFGVMPFHNF